MKKIHLTIALSLTFIGLNAQSTYKHLGDSSETTYIMNPQALSTYDLVNDHYYYIKAGLSTGTTDTINRVNICGQVTAQYVIGKNSMFNPLYHAGSLYGYSSAGICRYNLTTQSYSIINASSTVVGLAQANHFFIPGSNLMGNLRYMGTGLGYNIELINLPSGTLNSSVSIGNGIFEIEYSPIDDKLYALSSSGMVSINYTTGSVTPVSVIPNFFSSNGSIMGSSTFNPNTNDFFYVKPSGTLNKDTLIQGNVTTGVFFKHVIPRGGMAGNQYSDNHKCIFGQSRNGYAKVELQYIPYKLLNPNLTHPYIMGGISSSNYYGNESFYIKDGAASGMDTIVHIDLCGGLIQKILVPNNLYTAFEYSPIDNAFYSISNVGFSKYDLSTHTHTLINATGYTNIGQGSQSFDDINNLYSFRDFFFNGTANEYRTIILNTSGNPVYTQTSLSPNRLLEACWNKNNGNYYGINHVTSDLDFITPPSVTINVLPSPIINGYYTGETTIDHDRNTFIYHKYGTLGIDTLLAIDMVTGNIVNRISFPFNHMISSEALSIGYIVGAGATGIYMVDFRPYPTPNGNNIYTNLSAYMPNVKPGPISAGDEIEWPDTVVHLTFDPVTALLIYVVPQPPVTAEQNSVKEPLHTFNIDQNLTLTIHPLESNHPIQFTLFDLTGKVVASDYDYTNGVNLSHLSSGIYILKINNEVSKIFLK